jgi:predicted protein tyrosine phosphatase
MSCILQSFLYLGDVEDATNESFLKTNNIKHILNCTLDIPFSNISSIVTTQRIPVQDSSQENIYKYFEQAIDYILMAKGRNEAVLVHCRAGISRSVTIVVAYLMKEKGWDFTTALKYVKSKRSLADPNIGFCLQLVRFCHELRGTQ